jgi:hypothetical protein
MQARGSSREVKEVCLGWKSWGVGRSLEMECARIDWSSDRSGQQMFVLCQLAGVIKVLSTMWLINNHKSHWMTCPSCSVNFVLNHK